MINEHDIKDWHNTPLADNSKGWVVQQFLKGIGWQDVEGPYVLKGTAEHVRNLIADRDKDNEYRVYESLS